MHQDGAVFRFGFERPAEGHRMAFRHVGAHDQNRV
jgi:hypothetical protein